MTTPDRKRKEPSESDENPSFFNRLFSSTKKRQRTVESGILNTAPSTALPKLDLPSPNGEFKSPISSLDKDRIGGLLVGAASTNMNQNQAKHLSSAHIAMPKFSLGVGPKPLASRKRRTYFKPPSRTSLNSRRGRKHVVAKEINREKLARALRQSKDQLFSYPMGPPETFKAVTARSKLGMGQAASWLPRGSPKKQVCFVSNDASDTATTPAAKSRLKRTATPHSASLRTGMESPVSLTKSKSQVLRQHLPDPKLTTFEDDGSRIIRRPTKDNVSIGSLSYDRFPDAADPKVVKAMSGENREATGTRPVFKRMPEQITERKTQSDFHEPVQERPKAKKSRWGEHMFTKNVWQCPTCLSHNDLTRNKCAACEALRPGTESEKSGGGGSATNVDTMKGASKPMQFESSGSSSSVFGFGVASKDSAQNGITFGVDSSAQSKKPTPEKQASFSFGDKAPTNSDAAKPSFSFGITNTHASTPATEGAKPFTFGVKNGTDGSAKHVDPKKKTEAPDDPKSLFGSKVASSHQTNVETKNRDAVGDLDSAPKRSVGFNVPPPAQKTTDDHKKQNPRLGTPHPVKERKDGEAPDRAAFGLSTTKTSLSTQGSSQLQANLLPRGGLVSTTKGSEKSASSGSESFIFRSNNSSQMGSTKLSAFSGEKASMNPAAGNGEKIIFGATNTMNRGESTVPKSPFVSQPSNPTVGGFTSKGNARSSTGFGSSASSSTSAAPTFGSGGTTFGSTGFVASSNGNSAALGESGAKAAVPEVASALGSNTKMGAPAPPMFGSTGKRPTVSPTFESNTSALPVGPSVFGSTAQAPVVAPHVFGATPTTGTPSLPGFGSQSSAPGPSGVSFGASTSIQQGTGNKGFGTENSLPFGSVVSTSSNQGFGQGRFGGSSAPQQNSAGFQFGSSTPAPAPGPTQGGGFSFSTPAPAPNVTFGATPMAPNTAPAGTSGFNFGEAPSTPAADGFAGTNGFNRAPQGNMSTPAPIGGFNIGSAGPRSTGKRRYVRARRPPGSRRNT